MKRTNPRPTKGEKILIEKDLQMAELRLLVANYYLTQEMRKRLDMQIRHLGDKELLPISVQGPEIFAGYEEGIAKTFKKMLPNNPVARWIVAQRGIGPIIAAGLLSHIDIKQAPTAGHIWRFAGLDPSMKWKKGKKRPYNAQLKQICWHAGQCFMKQSNDPDCFYGKLYRSKKQHYIARNEAGGFADKAKVYKGVVDAANKKLLAAGKVPPAYIDACARRFAVKIFLSHLQIVLYWHEYKQVAPKPFALTVMGHAHEIEIPHVEMFPALAKAYYKTGIKGSERAGTRESTAGSERADERESTV
jgi:hypothetical protein